MRWEGQGADEIGVDNADNRTLIRIDPIYFRPTEVDLLVGDFGKAKRDFGWEPEIGFDQMVTDMVNRDLLLFEHGVPNAPVGI